LRFIIFFFCNTFFIRSHKGRLCCYVFARKMYYL
jgi:hypothetical protein